MSPLGDRQPIHATLIAARRAGVWQGVLLRGRSGAGKSDLALRACVAGWMLVADDRVRLWSSGQRLYGAAPATLTGLIEARGHGVARWPHLAFARLALAVDPETEPPAGRDRAPDPGGIVVAGDSLPLVRLPFLEAGAVARLDLALDAALRRRPTL